MKVNELNIKDLMVGDWVEVPFLEGKPKIVKVEEILSDEINPMWDGMENYGGIKIKYVKPIPLTPEILEKNGFVKSGTPGIHAKCYELDNQVEKYNLIIADYNQYKRLLLNVDSEDSECFNIKCDYVHELQHALKLCGIEKQIEL